MYPSLFTKDSPGKLQEITVHGSSDWAFIPDPLPMKWRVPEQVWPLLTEAREALARLDGVGKHMPSHELLLRPLQDREALRSSSLEGTYATPKQLLMYEIDPREPKSQHDPVNAWREVSNYRKALSLGQELLKKLPISLRFIRELHRALLSGVRGDEKDPGNFRRGQVHLGTNRRFIPPPLSELGRCLDEFEKHLHKEVEIDPLLFCFMAHYQFETIHPFSDGNGRVGRVLLSLMIFERCNLVKPWLYLSSFFEKYKREYIDTLFEVSTKGDWEGWISYCLRATIFQAKDAILRLENLVSLRERYIRSLASHRGSIRLHSIMEALFEVPVITIPQVAEMLHVSYPTAKADIEALVETGILVELEVRRRPKVLIAPEILDIAHTDQVEG